MVSIGDTKLTMPCTQISKARHAYYSGDTLLSPCCWWGLGGGRVGWTSNLFLVLDTLGSQWQHHTTEWQHQNWSQVFLTPKLSTSWSWRRQGCCVWESHVCNRNPKHHFGASRNFLDFVPVSSNWQKPKSLLSPSKEKEIRNLGSFSAPGKNHPQWQFGIN